MNYPQFRQIRDGHLTIGSLFDLHVCKPQLKTHIKVEVEPHALFSCGHEYK